MVSLCSAIVFYHYDTVLAYINFMPVLKDDIISNDLKLLYGEDFVDVFVDEYGVKFYAVEGSPIDFKYVETK